MHIVVTLKQVYDPNTPPALLQVGEDGKSVSVRSGMSPVLNGYDANAIEEAIRIKEKVGGTITAISVGDEQGINHIRRAIAMGGDAGVHVQGPTGLDCDSVVIATLIAAAIKKLGSVDLVICGKASSDTDAGQTHLILAEMLGISAVSPIKAVREIDADSIVVDRMGEDAVQRIKAKFPLLIGVSNEINKPRAPALKGVMMAKKVVVPSWSIADLGIDEVTPGVKIKKMYLKPVATVQTTMIADGRALAERLVEEGVI